uniref:Uncharacterized protein n=1 Tax=Leersia perrieri TaxID=77586 RepID=A0A0D9VIR1_9ORYZ
MGLCFSKKKKDKPSPGAEATSPKSKKKSGKIAVVVADEKGKKTPQSKRAGKAVDPAPDKKAVFVVKTKSGGVNVEEKKRPPGEEAVVVTTTMPVRTSSCTREEVDAILIQCGRLSRSSSGRAASSETGHRRSKRSYDFDQERKADWERHGGAVSRPSPHRGSPQRKRSGSRERSGGGGGSRRASRSPGRRGEGASSAAASPAGSGGGGERVRQQQQQPGKMVSVPAREKVRAPSPAAASGKRCASPRSSSPARVPAVAGNENAGGGGGGQMTAAAVMTPSLSRSSSPYRRSPMAEIDENALRNTNGNPLNANLHKKSSENAVATAPQKVVTERSKETKPKPVEEMVTVLVSETRAPPSSKTATRTASVAAESVSTKARSRRASRDFDQNTNSYATQLLEDIQSYHHQQQNTTATATVPAFSLPACVSKACSILEAVADLNSTSSESRSIEPSRSAANDKGSVNAAHGVAGMDHDDLAAEPSVQNKRFTLSAARGGEAEPQESAGSNSVSGNPWTTPSWEPSSVESSDRTWSASRSTTNNADEVVEQGGGSSSSHGGAGAGARRSPNRSSRQSGGGKQRMAAAQPEHSVRSRAGSSAGNNNINNVHRGRSARRNGGGGGSSVVSGRGAWAASVIG